MHTPRRAERRKVSSRSARNRKVRRERPEGADGFAARQARMTGYSPTQNRGGAA